MFLKAIDWKELQIKRLRLILDEFKLIFVVNNRKSYYTLDIL